jgi:hypothetical protein
MSARCAKTEAGRTEIKARALPLSRTARNLLLIIDASKPATDWISLVQGATQSDLDGLLAQGLIEPLSSGSARESRADPLLDAVNALTYGELYTLLTDQARARFGLIKGYRMVLEIEKASGLPELQALAQRFIAQVREEHGEAGLRGMRQALGLS